VRTSLDIGSWFVVLVLLSLGWGRLGEPSHLARSQRRVPAFPFAQLDPLVPDIALIHGHGA
jgi:hypothetical protein